MIYVIREDMLKQHGSYNEYYISKDFSNEIDNEYIDTLLNHDQKGDSNYIRDYVTSTFFRVNVLDNEYSMEINEMDNNDVIVMDI